MYQATVRNSGAWDGSMRSEWAFDTVRSASAMGTFRSMARDLMPPGMIPDEEDEDEDSARASALGPESLLSSGAVKGSDVTARPGALGVNALAGHSTVMVRAPSQASEKGEPTLEPELEPAAVADVPPPAYSGTVRGSRRSSYAARQAVDGRGTPLREADLGTGVDTIRPVKKVDKEGSLRLSADFVGSLRAREASTGTGPSSPSSPSSPVKDRAVRRAASEAGKAGKSMVEDIVLPTLQKVILHVGCARLPADNAFQSIRDDMDAREIEALSMLSRGFHELGEANPELAYSVILDMLQGINE